MPITCAKGTSGGKGNKGMFIERDNNMRSAGVLSEQPEELVKSNLGHNHIQEEVDALNGDGVKSGPSKVTSLLPLRNTIPSDSILAGSFGEGSLLINPPIASKFQSIVEDFEQTNYNAYWDKQLGKVRDVYGTAGRKNQSQARLCDIVLPKNPIPEKLPSSRSVAYQTDRNYCRDTYNPNKLFGMIVNPDKRGPYMKCCLTDDRVKLGTCYGKPINPIQANYRSTAPYDNLRSVPKGFAFKIPNDPDPFDSVLQCVTMCELNPDKVFFKKCIDHLNRLRKRISKCFDGSFFDKMFLNLKKNDKDNSGWLPKKIVYDYCATKNIRFNVALMEPLLSAWNAFEGSRIEYKTFVYVLNFTKSLPNLPNVQDIGKECMDSRTTYGEMVKPGQEIDLRARAGLPSGKYFDMNNPVKLHGCCEAGRSDLLHESGAKACLCPSTFTDLGF